MQVANFIRKTGKRQTTRFAGQLEIGTNMKIACKIFTKVGSTHYSIKQYSTISDNCAGDARASCHMEEAKCCESGVPLPGATSRATGAVLSPQ